MISSTGRRFAELELKLILIEVIDDSCLNNRLDYVIVLHWNNVMVYYTSLTDGQAFRMENRPAGAASS